MKYINLKTDLGKKETFKKWKEESNSIICLSVDNEFELEKYYHKFRKDTDD